MSRTVVVRKERWRRALAITGTFTMFLGSVLPGVASASTLLNYRDEFLAESYIGSDGSNAWLSPWIESGENDGPAKGAIQVADDGHCHTDRCLMIGKDGPGYASVYRSFGANGATSISLSFNYERHRHGAGAGSIQLAASQSGTTWTVLDTLSLQTEDQNQTIATYDLSAYAGPDARIRFSLLGGSDDSHINVDNLEIVAVVGSQPTFDQDLQNRTDSEGSVIAIDASATDPEADTLSYSATGLPPGVLIDTVSGIIIGVIDPSAGAGSPYTTTVTVSDGTGTSSDSFIWTISATNQAPTAADRPVSLAEDDVTGQTIDLIDPTYANDPDGDQLFLTDLDTSTVTGWMITNNGDGTVWVVPYPNFDGTDRATYTISDDRGGTITAALVLSVQPTPDPPQIDSPPSLIGQAGTTITYAGGSGDPDSNETLNFSLENGAEQVPPGAQVDPSTGEFSWSIPTTQTPGTYQLWLKLTDSTGLSAMTPLTIDVTPIPATPPSAPVPTAPPGPSSSTTVAIPKITAPTPPVTTAPTPSTAPLPTTISPPPVATSPTTIAPDLASTPESIEAPPSEPAPQPEAVGVKPTMTADEATAAKEDLVSTMVAGSTRATPEEYSSPMLSPREGLAVSFASAVETLKNNLVMSLILGLLLATFLLIGVEKREGRDGIVQDGSVNHSLLIPRTSPA